MPRWMPGLVFVCLVGWLPLSANVEMEGLAPEALFPWASFDPAIPTQKEIVGFHPGARPLTHGETMRYLETLAAASPRAEMRTYAHSHEGRRLVTFFVSDEQTIRGLDEFREAHLARVDPRGRPAQDDARALEGAKAVGWVAYGIHGDELSSVDAAVAMAYWLVAGEDERARNLRERLLVIIDPVENPDGRDRYLAQTRAFAHKVPNHDQDDLSHTAIWPWGRGNHYLFDLNRDWFSMVHPESARSAVIARWEPQLMVDSHEMGADDTYLFPPPRHPFNPYLPTSHRKWWDLFADDQAAALDRRGYPYYTREWNEEFFPGYGSSWASYRGALGILYEMSRTAGTVVKKRSGDLRTYAEATEHQVLSSLANLESLAQHRAGILADFVAERREMVAGESGRVTGWLLPEGRYPERTRALVRLLRGQGIDVLGRNGDPLRIDELRDGRSGAAVEASDLPAQTWLVPVRQPAGRLVRELLDPHLPMESVFLREERRSIERGEGSRLYETTAWSLPLNYGVEAYWTTSRRLQGFDGGVAPVEPRGLVAGDTSVGWLLDGSSDRSVGALADLLQRGIRVRVARKPFRIDDTAYDRGALLIRVEGNPEGLEDTLAAVAERWSVRIEPIGAGRAEEGPDLGGRQFPTLVAPRVGVWTGPGISSSEYGAIWHLLDEIVALRFSGIDVSRNRTVDLRRYNVLIFPSGSDRALGSAGAKRVKAWIEAGGTAIGIGGGAEFLASKEHEITRARLRREALEDHPPVVLGPPAEVARDAGLFHATGMRAPKPWKQDDEEDEKEQAEGSAAESPYDVAPVLGAGALPFTAGHAQGTAVSGPPVELAEWARPLLPPGESKPDKELISRVDERLRSFQPRGAHLRVEIDPELWLSWGLPGELPVLARARDTLVAAPPVQVPARFAPLDRLHLGGLLWPEGAARIAETAYATRERVGRGQVVLFLNDPEFRAWTMGTRRMLTNAILYGPGLGSSWSTPW